MGGVYDYNDKNLEEGDITEEETEKVDVINDMEVFEAFKSDITEILNRLNISTTNAVRKFKFDKIEKNEETGIISVSLFLGYKNASPKMEVEHTKIIDELYQSIYNLHEEKYSQFFKFEDITIKEIEPKDTFEFLKLFDYKTPDKVYEIRLSTK